ncbi:MAG: DUF72 domain-containing protein [Burkholderiales bacterium]
MIQAEAIYVGCCGFPMAKPEYFKRFPTVEVQQTFYQPPRPETLRNWRRAAPPEFQFHLKAWQRITHESSSPTYRRLKARILRISATVTEASVRPTKC